MSKLIIIEGNSNDKDQIRTYMVKGEKGDKGDQGPIGDNQLQIGTVTGGENASAEIIGTSPNQTLNLVLPKGDKGDPTTVYDEYSISTTEPYSANFINNNIKLVTPLNAGAHNSIYRGENITDLFYNGTLSEQIANETFDDIFIGDYIIGQNSGTKYLVADINYRLNTGDTECLTPHVLMIPEKIMGTANMNDADIVTGAHVGSKMYLTNLGPYKTIIENDFGSGHILSHRTYLANTVTDGYESNGSWYDSTVELMNEIMVYGSNIFHNIINGTHISNNITIDRSQLSLFRLDKNKIIAKDENENRTSYWLRDVVSTTVFAYASTSGISNYHIASALYGIRPAFLIY